MSGTKVACQTKLSEVVLELTPEVESAAVGTQAEIRKECFHADSRTIVPVYVFTQPLQNVGSPSELLFLVAKVSAGAENQPGEGSEP